MSKPEKCLFGVTFDRSPLPPVGVPVIAVDIEAAVERAKNFYPHLSGPTETKCIGAPENHMAAIEAHHFWSVEIIKADGTVLLGDNVTSLFDKG